MGPRAPGQLAAEDDVQPSAANMKLTKTSSGEPGELSSGSSGSSSSRSTTSLANLADESISHAATEEPSNHATAGESSLTPVQWEAWSLPTETWGHYESATDLAGGSCQDLTTTTTTLSRDSPQEEQESQEAASPPLLADIGRRLASLPNLAEAGAVVGADWIEKQDRKDTTGKSATTARRRKTATGTGSTVSMTSTTRTTITPKATTSITSIEQLKIRTLQTEIHRLQSQLLNLQTTHERTLKSASRYKSKCSTLQGQLDEAHAENDHLRQEVQDLKTLVKLEEEARLVGAIDALWMEEEDRSTTPPTQIEVEVPVPSSLPMGKDPTKPTARTRRHSLDAMELSGLERHDFTNRVA